MFCSIDVNTHHTWMHEQTHLDANQWNQQNANYSMRIAQVLRVRGICAQGKESKREMGG